MRVLMFNLATDTADPVLGFTTRWIQELAAKVDEIEVVTVRAGVVDVPANVAVHSLGGENGLGRSQRIARFYWTMARLMRQKPPDVCFAHMAPAMAVLAAPLLKARHVPLITWYAHRAVSPTLKLAHHLSDTMVSIGPESYPYRHEKVRFIGHGIDTEQFSSDGAEPQNPPLIVSIGRLSPLKDQMTLLRAAALLRSIRPDVRWAFVGGAPDRDAHYASELDATCASLGLDDTVEFVGPVPFSDVVLWHRKAAIHVNGSPTDHSLDKAALEAMACERLSVSSAAGFRSTMGQWADVLVFRSGDHRDLSGKLQHLLDLNPSQRMRMGADLRDQVVRMHDLNNLTDALRQIFADAVSRRS